MSNQVALVTGGLGGIGYAICKALHDIGIQVIATYHHNSLESAKGWQLEQKKNGYHFDIVHVDVGDFTSCEHMAKEVIDKYGKVDILVNNAGITRDRSCNKMTKEDWDIVINTDLNSIFYVTHSVLAGMRARKYGRIINISSINGQKGQFGQVNYSAAKAGIHGFTKALALETATHQITVNTISPGYVETDMILSLSSEVRNKILTEIPMGRFAKPDEIARVVAFLAHENSSYITGANITINGGHYML